MLGDKDVIATVAVADLDAARRFYEGVLGIKVVHARGGSTRACSGSRWCTPKARRR